MIEVGQVHVIAAFIGSGRIFLRRHLTACVSIAPLIMGLNDDQIPEILERAAQAGATGAFLTLLRLPAEVAEVFALAAKFSGIAASAAGYAIDNPVLIIAGALVGASGIILAVMPATSPSPSHNMGRGRYFLFSQIAMSSLKPTMMLLR